MLVLILVAACGGVHPDMDAGQPIVDGAQAIRKVTVQRSHAGTGTVTATAGGIACGSVCNASVPDGTTMVLTAAPDEKSVFAGWSGPCNGTDLTCSFTVSGDVTVGAMFDVKRYTLTVVIAEPGSGTVTGAPGGLSCPGNCSISVDVGAQVTLTATPSAGWRSVSWSVAACSGAGPCGLTINADQTVTATFIAISCGNGVKEGTEECDDGNRNDHDDCTNACKVARCGDSIQKTAGTMPLEQCDDGNSNSNDDCTNACTTARCGDSIQQTSGSRHEECDDGNGVNTDDCTNVCTTARCGDSIQQTSGSRHEECDDGDGINTNDCTNACKKAVCGDGIPWTGHEECDDGDGINTNDCTNACKRAVCGDGIPWSGHEECDDGDGINTNDCTNACKRAVCGDGIPWSGHEECDDGNGDNNFCNSTCHCGGPGEPCCATGTACDGGTGCLAHTCTTCPGPPVTTTRLFQTDTVGNNCGGNDEVHTYSVRCTDGNHREACQTNILVTPGDASCNFVGWANPNDPSDCSCNVRYVVPMHPFDCGRHITCSITITQTTNPPPHPDGCP